MTNYLGLEDLLKLADDLNATDLGDLGWLASAAYRPSVRLFGREAYPDLDLKAAALADSLMKTPQLSDPGRLTWLVLVVFYGLNGVELHAPGSEVPKLLTALGTGRLSLAEVANTLSSWR